MRLLILGGTMEASALARRLAGRTDVEPILSFAGRTRELAAPPIPFRVGGFGAAAGLQRFLTGKGLMPSSTQPTHLRRKCRGTLLSRARPSAFRWRASAGRPGTGSTVTVGPELWTWRPPYPRWAKRLAAYF